MHEGFGTAPFGLRATGVFLPALAGAIRQREKAGDLDNDEAGHLYGRVLTPDGTTTYEGRTAWKYTVTLAPAPEAMLQGAHGTFHLTQCFGKDFVCLEPWTAPADALNRGEGLREVAPRGTDEHFVEISFEASASIRP